jgi:hypothetical protein
MLLTQVRTSRSGRHFFPALRPAGSGFEGAQGGADADAVSAEIAGESSLFCGGQDALECIWRTSCST